MSDVVKGTLHLFLAMTLGIVGCLFPPFLLLVMVYLLWVLYFLIKLWIKDIRANRARRRELEAMLAAMPEAEREAYILKRMRAANTRRHFYWRGGWMYDRDI